MELELMSNYITNSKGLGDTICNYCIAILEDLSSVLGVSYGTLKVVLFVIIQPLLIIMFMSTTTLLCLKQVDVQTKKRLYLSTVITFGVIVVLFCIIFWMPITMILLAIWTLLTEAI